jgi:hypothetical protein
MKQGLDMEPIIQRLLDELKLCHERELEEVRAAKKIQEDEPYRSDEVKDLVIAIGKAQGEFPPIKFNRVNSFHKNEYGDLCAILQAIRPALTKHGLCITQEMRLTKEGGNVLHTRLWHISGQFIESRLRIVPSKSGIQEFGSAVTYSRRYSIQALLCVFPGNDPDDDDGEIDMAEVRKEDTEAEKKPGKKYEKTFTKSYETITQEQLLELEIELGNFPDEDGLKKLMESIFEEYRIRILADMPKSGYFPSLDRIRRIKETYSKRRL